MRSGAKAVPQPIANLVVWAGAGAGALLLVGVLNALGVLDRTGLALAVLCSLAAVLGTRGRFAAAPGTAVLCWLVLNVFATHPTGEVSWAGHRDPEWLVYLLVAGLTGAVASRIVSARAAYRRVTPQIGRGGPADY
ncbi:hypothetical protein [Streptomyces formicae]|uniref:Putative integral membrane protein n=1 Tax=Streptomyces formicae TaxID=1616117 RepID=A0A291Q2Y0_9ACTN|nr:hypothetical protein [Streptomyces formicae]ATL25824.1 putative integral membrane protein [Streptomyces formicae]